MIKQVMLLTVIVSGIFFSMQPAMAVEVVEAVETVEAIEGNEGMVTVYHCPMCDLTMEKAGQCPKCGADLEEKEMTAADAQAAMDEAQKKMKNIA